MANNIYKRNMVGSIMMDGRMLGEPLEIKEATVEYFSRNFFEEKVHRAVLRGEFPRRLSRSAALELEKDFEEGEIVAALKGCKFHVNARFTKGINFTFVALIPKVDCPSSFREYRPISMVGWIYKILSKLLVNRLRVHIPSVIGEAQAAFIGGKQILDGVLVANEVIHCWKNKAR
ncbi:uncharacterized protein LOC131313831 [Rhododendron vialii]|uniref:uncharacterized protein LOC131313831 n=1 Tax=Rhododendron vialii TaxID=182163 RepID=UPI00265D6791|nr:uncharacterized protein LOC131313831 [Rhododendron vialii]